MQREPTTGASGSAESSESTCKVPCLACDGEGYTLPLVVNASGMLDHVREECDTCKGEGWVLSDA